MDIRLLAAVFVAELDPDAHYIRVEVIDIDGIGQCMHFVAGRSQSRADCAGAIYPSIQLDRYSADLAVRAAREVNGKLREQQRGRDAGHVDAPSPRPQST